MSDQQHLARLSDNLQRLGTVAVAFSGGADSTLLLAVALRALGPERVLAVTADSPTLPRSELGETRALAAELGARHLIIATEELADEGYAANTPDRCYYCKQELFERMRAVATAEGLEHLAYGATADDLGDHRPGMRAAREAGARAPLLEAGLTKADVRRLSHALGLRTWDKPAMACLSSRFPYGTRITAGGLGRVEAAEDLLRRELGFRQVRVRDVDGSARIEIEPAELGRLIADPVRERVVETFKALGYRYVTVDLQGYRSGSLNEVLESHSPGHKREPRDA